MACVDVFTSLRHDKALQGKNSKILPTVINHFFQGNEAVGPSFSLAMLSLGDTVSSSCIHKSCGNQCTVSATASRIRANSTQ